MGATFKKRDKNRYRKVYPTFRRPAVNSYLTTSRITIEVAEVQFSLQETIKYSFKENFLTAPIVTIVAVNGDVNVYVGEVTNENVLLSSSAPFGGSVFLHAIEMGS